jgi:hypothetical protein
MSNFIVNTDVPNLKVVIREGDAYNINIVPGRISTIRTGSFTSYADFAGTAATASYISGSSVYAASASYAITASYAPTSIKEIENENRRFPIALISASQIAVDSASHFVFNPYIHTLTISSSNQAVGILSLSPNGLILLSGSSSALLNRHGMYADSDGKSIGIAANASRFNPFLTSTNPAIVILSSSGFNTAYTPIEFEGSGSYTDGRVTVTTPLVVKQDVEVTGSVISDEYKLKAGQVSITFTGSINTGIFGISEYVEPFISTASYAGASIEYIAQRPGATRMGIIMATWAAGSELVFTDFSTADVGDTSDISFVFSPSGSYYRLRVNSGGTGSGAWTVQSLFKLFPNLGS